jgi:hypothetical protein
MTAHIHEDGFDAKYEIITLDRFVAYGLEVTNHPQLATFLTRKLSTRLPGAYALNYHTSILKCVDIIILLTPFPSGVKFEFGLAKNNFDYLDTMVSCLSSNRWLICRVYFLLQIPSRLERLSRQLLLLIYEDETSQRVSVLLKSSII